MTLNGAVMQSSPNHHYKIEIIVRDTSDDVHGIYEDIEHLLGGCIKNPIGT